MGRPVAAHLRRHNRESNPTGELLPLSGFTGTTHGTVPSRAISAIPARMGRRAQPGVPASWGSVVVNPQVTAGETRVGDVQRGAIELDLDRRGVQGDDPTRDAVDLDPITHGDDA